MVTHAQLASSFIFCLGTNLANEATVLLDRSDYVNSPKQNISHRHAQKVASSYIISHVMCVGLSPMCFLLLWHWPSTLHNHPFLTSYFIIEPKISGFHLLTLYICMNFPIFVCLSLIQYLIKLQVTYGKWAIWNMNKTIFTCSLMQWAKIKLRCLNGHRRSRHI